MSLYINAFKQGALRMFTLPRLSLPLISTLGLTLAAVLTVVAVANTLLFQPLPDVDENNLYQIELSLEISEGFAAPFFSDPRRIASVKQSFDQSLSWGQISPGGSTIEVSSNEIPVVRFDAVSGTPEVLGLRLLLGQGSDIDNAQEGIWISKSLWQSAFAGVNNLTTQTLRLEGLELPIFGVFDDFTSVEVGNVEDQLGLQIWRFRKLDTLLQSPDNISLSVGTLAFVRGNRSTLPQPIDIQNWFIDYVDTDITIDRAKQFLLSKPAEAEITPYRDAFIGDSQALVFLLMIAMVSLLVMACLNLLNMFIAHYQSRNKEFSIQLCMGSSVARLRGLNFTENLPMFLMATLIGLIAASWLIKILPTLAGDNLPMLDLIELDLTSVVIALLVIVLINFVFAFISIIYVDKKTLTDSLNSSGKGTPGQQKQSINQALMIFQLTLACVLLTTAIASVKNSYQSTYTDLGYSMLNAYEVSMLISDDEWRTSLESFEQYRGSEFQQLRADFTQRLSNLGGDVLDIHQLPLTGNVSMSAYPDPETGDSIMIRPMFWGPGMLSTFGIELLAGRELNKSDIDVPNILIAKSFAAQQSDNGNWEQLVGTELRLGDEPDEIFKVVGIVEDIMPLPSGAINIDAPEVYFSSPERFSLNRLSAVVIMPEDQRLEFDSVGIVLNGLDARLTELQVDSMNVRWQRVTEASRLNMYVVMGLAGLTLMLAAIGVSGLSQMTASQKRYELAVRMATGAKQSKLLLLLVKDSLWMLIIGLSLGVLAAVSAYQYLLTFFEGAPAFDWTVTSAINFLLAFVMLLSIAIPGWSVIRKDPMQALREL